MQPVKVNQPNKNWQPVQHPFVRDATLQEALHSKGYAVLPWIDAETVAKLKTLYHQLHTLAPEKGGMFYSLYSRDLEYRETVHEKIGALLQPVLEQHFAGYKNVINSFIIKSPGPESEFYVHQDTTGLDEFQHSALSLWIPMQDVTPENGALALVEKTHWLLSPHRGASFAFGFEQIQTTVREYLKPITMKAGEVLLFDSRLIHHSSTNTTTTDRVALVCGLFPEAAKFQTCWKDKNNPEAPIELFEHPDDYLLKYPHFFYNCHDRPVTGAKVGEVPHDFPQLSEEQFREFCQNNGVEAVKEVKAPAPQPTNIVAEPDGINRFEEPTVVAEKRGLWARLMGR